MADEIEPIRHKMTEAVPANPPGAPEGHHGPPEPTPGKVAEDTRRQQQARSDGIEDRDQRLTRLGRGEQTHG